MTTQEMKNEEPINEETCKLSPSSSPPAAIDEKISGAPLPRANRVTPASDSEHDNLSEIASSAGERYESAVEPKFHIAMTISNKARGSMMILLPVEQNVSYRSQ